MTQMHELMPGSGVYIHQENFQDVMSKSCNGYLVGKAIARYLMSCFWKSVSHFLHNALSLLYSNVWFIMYSLILSYVNAMSVEYLRH